MSGKENAWSVRDLITAVLLAMLMIVIQVILNVVFMLNNFVSMVLSTGIIVLVVGAVYPLLISRVPKRGVTLLYCAMTGIAYLLSGNWYLLPWFILVGLVSEAILWKRGSYGKRGRVIASWTANGLLHQGTNILPIAFFWDVYYTFAMESGMEQSYVDDYLKYYTDPAWLAFILALTAVCAFLGVYIGTKLLDKHFSKAGVL